jgi:hypothetical protein
LFNVANDGLAFAEEHPEQFTLLANKTRKSYKGHTPNMVAFSSLFHAIHEFCDRYKVSPKVFYHDQQSEFGPSMKEFHQLYSSGLAVEYENGFLVPKIVDYQLGSFSLQSSRDVYSLQVVDLFLWLNQRKVQSEIENTLARLQRKTGYFYISRQWSEMTKLVWVEALSQQEWTTEQDTNARHAINQMNQRVREKYLLFLKNQDG